MARFNAGDEVGALGVLDDLQRAQDAALQKRADIEKAAGRRRVAALALEARAKGKQTTAQVIARYEEVTRLDPGVHWDWVELSRLYRDAGTLADSMRTARRAADTASNDLERSSALHELGNVLARQGDGAGALAAYRKGLAIAEALAARDPANYNWQNGLAVSYRNTGDALVIQGDVLGALAAYRKSLGIGEALARIDPANTDLQQDVWVSYNKVGNVLLAR